MVAARRQESGARVRAALESASISSVDVVHMASALALAERGRGRTTPNPMVGALVVDAEGVVVGRGAHEFAGGPHAEVHALAEAGARARGATLYCTLEPCSHTGRTGPCAPRVVEAGISRAVVAVQDPDPRVAGRGLALLRKHGVTVSVGALRAEASRLNSPFFSVMRRQRPFVTMKVALSRDGFVSASTGTRTLLTGAAANRLIHRERAEVDALGVGSGTMLADDPLLTPRGAYRTRPLARIIFDRSLRVPASARIFGTLTVGPVIILARKPVDPAAHPNYEALVSAGAKIELVDSAGGEFISRAVSSLVRLEINSLLVEGGPTLHAALWAADVVDRVQIYQAPALLGPAGVPWFMTQSVSVDRLSEVKTTVLGEDVLIEGYVHRSH